MSGLTYFTLDNTLCAVLREAADVSSDVIDDSYLLTKEKAVAIMQEYHNALSLFNMYVDVGGEVWLEAARAAFSQLLDLANSN